MWEILLPKRRDKWGNRYGFVRFHGVQNEGGLEKQLDGIRIDGNKINVNIPKFSKIVMEACLRSFYGGWIFEFQ